MKRRVGQAAIAIAVAWAIAAMPRPAHAQRGGDFITQGEAPDTPKRGFPGAFNTHMPASGSVVTNFTLLQIDYGVTENLSVGGNALPAATALAGEAPGAIASLRYRLYERGRVSAVAAFHAGYVPLGFLGEEAPDRAWGGYASTTVGLQLSERQRLAGTLLAATVRTSNARYRERSSLGTIGIAADYELFMTQKLGVNLTAIGIPVLTSSLDSPGESTSVTLRLPVQDGVIVRALGLVRLGKTWLLEGGAVAPLSLAGATPWLSVTKTW